MKNITVSAKRWFQKSMGNTYHSVRVSVDGGPWESSGIHYGYDEAYLDTAAEMLEKNGVSLKRYSSGAKQSLTRWCKENNVEIYHNVVDVARKGDL